MTVIVAGRPRSQGLRLVFAVLALLHLPGLLASEPLTAIRENGGVRVRQGDRPVLFFQQETKDLNGKWPRANYVHPLYNAAGDRVITEDFPDDHGHHRGIFWAWHQVKVGGRQLGDAWLCRDFQWEVKSVEFVSPASPLSLKTVTHWKSPEWLDDSGQVVPFVEERVTMTIHALEANRRIIDFEITLRALVSNVEIGGSEDRKGYGGFSPRVRLSTDQTFRGERGLLEPQTTAVDAGSWVEIDGDEFRIKVSADRSNPPPVGAPEPTLWILRRQRSMQNAVFPGRRCVPLSREEPTVLKYRLEIE